MPRGDIHSSGHPLVALSGSSCLPLMSLGRLLCCFTDLSQPTQSQIPMWNCTQYAGKSRKQGTLVNLWAVVNVYEGAKEAGGREKFLQRMTAT